MSKTKLEGIPTKMVNGLPLYMLINGKQIMIHDGVDVLYIQPDQIDQVIQALTELKKEIEG